MPITISDTFTRTNTANGTLGSTETGAVLPWQNATNWRINTNTATNDSVSASPAWVTLAQPSVTASVLTGSTNGPGVAFWVQDANDYWMAYMYSNRYLDSITTNCSAPCSTTITDCSCGGCNTNAVTYTRSLGTGTGSTTALSCGSCSVGSCSGAPTCTSAGSFNYGTYTSACSGSCTSKSVANQACVSTNKCGSYSTTNSCVNSCTNSFAVKRCGTASCGEIGTTCGGTCGSNSRTNRNCTGNCTKSGGGNVNAPNSCAGTANTCPPCAEGSTNNYRREYYFRVARVVAGSITNVVNTLYADTTSSGISVAAIKVITTGGSYRAIGYTDTAMTTIGVDTGTLASAQNDYLASVGHGMIRMDMGSANPNIGYAADTFTLVYEPLGGDSVGIIQG